ncbi:MAG: divalent-cation tolerance protein CutA [Pseudomonadota bacterium]
MTDDVVFLYVTTPDKPCAERIAAKVIEADQAACVNVLPPVQSHYKWKGALESRSETPLIIKTSTRAAPDARATVIASHPDDTPCIVALPVSPTLSHGPFLDWVVAQTAR